MLNTNVFNRNQSLIKICFDISLHIKSLISQYNDFRLMIHDVEDLKSEHVADTNIIAEVKKYLMEKEINVNVYFEGGESFLVKDPSATILIDPIDGSLNRDLGVGDPGCVFAFAPVNLKEIRFRDIFGGFVFGLHSNHIYASIYPNTYFYQDCNCDPKKILCDPDHPDKLIDSYLYLNDGYGSHFAKSSYEKAGALPLFVKHRNAFDNTALEICQICRGAAHIRVEARSTTINGKLKGSDHANILPAFAIGKGSGLIVTDIEGNSLEDEIVSLDKVSDFICCSNKSLLNQTIDILKKNREILKQYSFQN